MSEASKSGIIEKAEVPRCVAVTAGRATQDQQSHEALARWARAVEAEGVDAILVREKQLTARSLASLVRCIRLRYAGTLLVSERADVAAAVRADGVHLPASGVSIALARKALPSGLVGRSTHSLCEIERARQEAADYVFFGPVFDTPEKRDFGPPQGLESLRDASKLGLPVIAVGGITASSAPQVLAAGAHGVAAIRELATTDGARCLVTAIASARDPESLEGLDS